MIDAAIPSKCPTMLCRQRSDRLGTIARDQSGSSAMILLIFLQASGPLRLDSGGQGDLDVIARGS